MQGLRQVDTVPWEALAWLLRMVVGCILIYASADKILHPQDFAVIVKGYRLLPEALVNLTAIWLPWFELVLGVCLYAGLWRQGALLLATSLLAVFWLAIIVNYFRGIDVDCGCFSSTSPDSSAPAPMLWYIGRDALLLALPLAAWEAQRRAEAAQN
jgi:uncharacterized membrane protein YphA (DoxX/SURF4 family)